MQRPTDTAPVLRGKNVRLIRARNSHPHLVSIDGVVMSATAAVGFAKANGFDGTAAGLLHRIRRGATTLAELCAPVNKGQQANSLKRRAKREQSKIEMAALMAAIDARKPRRP